MKRFIFTTTLALVLAAASYGCGGKGEIGDGCDTAGATDECAEGVICTNNADSTFTCRKLCTDQAQCAANENCNGISNSNQKSCQPK